MQSMNRRSFMELGLTAAAASLAPRAVQAQATASAPPRQIDPANIRIKTTKLAENLFLLQGAGGNMVLQTGDEGNLLIDSSYAPAVPRILGTIASLGGNAPFVLINTHWHTDHTGGNEGLHSAGYTIVAHRNTRTRLTQPHTMAMLGLSIPPAPAGALPAATFDQSLQLWHNDDSLDLVHFEPAHTDTDILIHFHKADLLHVGDIWFNGLYPFIDESTGGSIRGMIGAGARILSASGDRTRIVPGHGPLGSKANYLRFLEMLQKVRDRVAALKAAGASEQEAAAKKPTAEWDELWGRGFVNPATFTGLVYRTL